jgi:hypothetical protein
MTQDQPLVARLRARSFDYMQTGRGSEGVLLDDAAEAIERLQAPAPAVDVARLMALADEYANDDALASAQGFVHRPSCYRAALESALQSALAAQPAPTDMSPEFTDTSRAALAWVLWHHQGSSSEIGQAMRFALGMGATERMSEHHVAEAKRWASLSKLAAPTEQAQPVQANGVKYIVTVVDNEHPNGIPWEQWVRARGHTPPTAQPAEQSARCAPSMTHNITGSTLNIGDTAITKGLPT